MKATRSNRVHHEASASELAARHRRAVAPQRKLRAVAAEPGRRARRRRRASFGVSRAWLVRLLRTGLVLGLALAIIVGVVGAYQAFASSRLFALRQVELRGAVHASRDELLRELRRGVSGSLWQADLAKLRRAIERHAWVREAEVARVLPDTLRVTINEREPFAPARRSNGSLVWVDRDGVVLGQRALFKTEAVLPLISGLEEGEGEAASEA